MALASGYRRREARGEAGSQLEVLPQVTQAMADVWANGTAWGLGRRGRAETYLI